MKHGIDPLDKNYYRIPIEDRMNLISWGEQGYIVQDPWGNQKVKWYPEERLGEDNDNKEVLWTT